MQIEQNVKVQLQNNMETSFVIEMENAGKGKWYMLNGTDLENPIIYVSSDGKEAFMIDVDFYGENVINQVIKSVIGDKCESLKIFLTHNHGDHVNNLAQIAKDVAPIDILVNNAGIIKRIPMCDMTAEQFRQVIDVDLNAPFISI